jgi:NAD(P)-dependent dehydrogenase (short-subunit alcohol dehydrogenase family)
MIEHGAGVIINVTSVAAYHWPVNRLAYVASKSALRTITEALAGEWAPHIRVNSVAPGYIETEMVAALVSAGHIDLRTVAAATPLGRLGQSDEVAQVVTFLCSDHAAYVTGVSIPVDGGWIVKPRNSL